MKRRNFLKIGIASAAATALAPITLKPAAASTQDKPAFVLVHGAWHGSWTWAHVIPLLTGMGHACIAIDLPGAGTNTNLPNSFLKRPLDPAAFATEKGKNAAVTQNQRTEATIVAVKQAAKAGNGKVVLVGHSLGGLTISPTAESIPELLHGVVYLTAFMVPQGMPAIAMITHEKNKAALVGKLFLADPKVTGVTRLDPRSEDPGYVATMRKAFYGDLTDQQARAAANLLHCDEPASASIEPSIMTKERFGTVPRHYIRCLQDRAITIDTQDHMISIVDQSLGNQTITHTLDTSHSPFFSAPKALVNILTKSAG